MAWWDVAVAVAGWDVAVAGWDMLGRGRVGCAQLWRGKECSAVVAGWDLLGLLSSQPHFPPFQSVSLNSPMPLYSLLRISK